MRSPVPAILVLTLVPALVVAAPEAPRPSHEEPLGEPVVDAAASAALAALAGPASCDGGAAAGVFACKDLDLTGFVSLPAMSPAATSGSNLWGFRSANDGREYAVMGIDVGTAVVEVTDPARPRPVGLVPGLFSRWREVKVFQRFDAEAGRWKAWAYVVTEAVGGGLQILDLSDLPDSVSLAATYRGFDTAHTVTLANVDPATGIANVPDVPPVLYIQGFDRLVDIHRSGVLALDLADPVAPALLGAYRDSYAHDTWTGVLRGARAAGCAAGHDPCELVVNWAGDAIRILDFTDKAHPEILSTLVYQGLGYAHSGWISADGNYLFSTDELDEETYGGDSRVRIVDVSDLRHPRVATTWFGPTRAIDHNGYVVGNLYYLANYERGVTVLDVTNPLAPAPVAFLDTFPSADDTAFHGVWGVYPFLPSGTILASSIDGAGGLFLLRLAPTAPIPREPVLPVAPRARDPRRVDGPRPFP